MQDSMAVFLNIAAAMLFLIGGSGLFLSFFAFMDRCRAYLEKRSLFEKSAAQLDSLCAVTLLIFASASDADCFFSGAINARMAQESGGIWFLFCICISAAAFLAVLTAIAKKNCRRMLSGLTCAVSLPSLIFLVLLSWQFFFRNGHAVLADGLFPSLVNLGGIAFCSTGFWLYAVCALCAMASSACLLASCWHIFCRSRNDYGRDFYAVVLGLRSRQASYFLLAFLAGLIASAVLGMVHEKLWLAADDFGYLLCLGLTLLIPAAFFFCRAVARDAMPMQKKSYIVIALLCFYAGAFACHYIACLLLSQGA